MSELLIPDFGNRNTALNELVENGLAFWNEDGEFCLLLSQVAVNQQVAVDYFTKPLENPYVAPTD